MKINFSVLGLIALMASSAHAQIYIDDQNGVGEYDPASGTALNATLVSGLSAPQFITLYGSNLYVSGGSAGVIGEYDAKTGAVINASLVSGLSSPEGIVVSGSILYVANSGTGIVGEYNAITGAAINASFITGLGSIRQLAVFNSNLYVSDSSNNRIGVYNATTGAVVNASFITGLNAPDGFVISGSTLYVANNGSGTIGEYAAPTGAPINTALVTGLAAPNGVGISGPILYVDNHTTGTIAEYDATAGTSIGTLVSGLSAVTGMIVVTPGSDVGGYNLQKTIIYDQTDANTITLDPSNPFTFEVNVVPGSSGTLLPYSTLSVPSNSTGSVAFNASSEGLTFREDFTSKSLLDAAFNFGTYNLTIQTSTPNTYSNIPATVGADNYPFSSTPPQIVSVTNATWAGSGVNNHLEITNPTQPTTITWTPFSSGNGSISFQVDNTTAGESVPALPTNNSYTIPGNALTNNTSYQASIGYTNNDGNSELDGIGGSSSFSNQINFLIEVGTPTPATSTTNLVAKNHVLLQTSNNTPANGTGDNDDFTSAPYSLQAQSSAFGMIQYPSGDLPLGFDPGAGTNSNANYQFISGPIADQATLDASYPDGNYTMVDGSIEALTGDAYPNTPQITQVNGAAPVWNPQGQLVLNPAIANTLTWTAFNILATTFASNGNETVKFNSDDGLVNLKSQAGVSTGVTTTFNTLTIPANQMTAQNTYTGRIEYFLATGISSPIANVEDIAGYRTEVDFTAVAANASGLAQTINFPALNPQQVINTSLSLVATASSGLPVAFAVASGPATISGNVVTFTGLGTVVVSANQAGNSTYQSAPTMSVAFNINTTQTTGSDQAINFLAITAQNAGNPLTLTATATSGLPVIYSVASGPATVSGNVVTFTGTGLVTINADQPGNGTYLAAGEEQQSFNVFGPTELNNVSIQKSLNYVQSSLAAPVLNADYPYQFQLNVNPGSTGNLLSTSTLTTPAGGAGTLPCQVSSNGLAVGENFQTKAALDAAFPIGNYNLNLQTDTPNTYTGTMALTADNYPTMTPQVTVTNATWDGTGHLIITNPTQPVVFTWPAFNSAVGSIFFNINSNDSTTSLASQSFPADGTNTSYTLPVAIIATMTANTPYEASLSFQNTTNASSIPGVSSEINYLYQLSFDIAVSTPTPPTASLYSVGKDHVLVQTSAGAPVDAALGDPENYNPGPYDFDIQSPAAGSTTGPTSTNYPLVFDAGSMDDYGKYRYSSGPIASLANLNTTYPDGAYTLADGNSVNLTGDIYPNVPQITLVNGFAPIWNAQGQLVLDPTVDNTLTWTPFSLGGVTFATNAHESAQLESSNDSSVDLQQKSGVAETTTTPFNTVTIPANTLTIAHTYAGNINYTLIPFVNIPSANHYDAAGYQVDNDFTVVAQLLPTALTPTFNTVTDVGVTANSYIATGVNLAISLGFAPTGATTLTVVNNTGSGPIIGTFNNVAEGGTISATFNSTTYIFTATYHGGDGNDITLTYTPALPPSSLTILHNFDDGTVPNDGANPIAKLTQGTDGNFYGMTQGGGSANAGTVFKITPQGQVTILHSFGDGTVTNDGSSPGAGLVLGSDGNFYGVASSGGTNSAGAAFKITPQGQVTILHSFNDGTVSNDGQFPENTLVQAADGNFYGITLSGGAAGDGTVFKMTPTGQITILHGFQDGSVANDGNAPVCALIQGSDGNLYGTTSRGGSSGLGTVYKISTSGQLTILHSFGDGSVTNDGANPQQGLVQGPDGNFYGTTELGGVLGPASSNRTMGSGAAYKITPQGAMTILHRFNDGSVANDGQIPGGELILGKDGNYYGITQNGGSTTTPQDNGTGNGTIFRMTPQGVVTILHSFQDGSVLADGALPQNGLVQSSDGTFYGMTEIGGSGSGNPGTLYKFVSTLPVFTSAVTANGIVGLPFSYQTTATNTPTNYSATNLPAGLTINPATGLITGVPSAPGASATVITLTNNSGPSSAPLTITISSLPVPVVASILTAFGTSKNNAFFSYQIVATNNPTSYDATGLPTGVTIDHSSGLISGNPTTPQNYSVSLTATNATGTSDIAVLNVVITGTALTPSDEYSILHFFNDGTVANDAVNPSVIFEGFDGTLYGVSSQGGANGQTSGGLGTIFNVTPQGTASVFYSFGSGLGDALASAPQGLIQAADGNFYGTTRDGGTASLGTVFKITQDGTVSVLHSFGDGSVTNDGANPRSSGLVQGTDGNFYGVTKSGGSQGLGTIYKITPLGAMTILHSFGDGTVASDGATPEANLLQGADGNYYGTTFAGGASSSGTIFKVTSAGAVTILHSFGGTAANDGSEPTASLIQQPNGTFYGTTETGGTAGLGTVFQMTVSGSTGMVTILHSFGGMAAGDGANPVAAVILGYDGNFYGMTNLGGSANEGTIFEMTVSTATPPTGTVTLIHQFGDGTVNYDGEFPRGPLYQDATGNFYGTTYGGGMNSDGTVFSIVATQTAFHKPIYTGPTSLSSPALTPFSFTPQAYFGTSSNGVGTALAHPALVGPSFSSATNWTLTGTLPQFLNFDSTTGTITGTPIEPGTYTVTLTPENANGSGTPQTVTLFIDVAPTISSKATDTGTAGTAYSYQIAGTASPLSYGATSLPGWLAVNTTSGVISGTPPGAGAYIFDPTATNVSGTGTQQVTLTVSNSVSSAPTLTSATTASVNVGSSFSYQIAATNSPTSYSAVSLPAGLVFNSTSGVISGMPTTVGSYQVPISATNATSTTSGILTLTVSAIVAPVITSSTMVSCTPSNPVTYQITGTNAPTSFSASGLPTGLSIDTNSGAITGTPMSAGTAMVTLSATNNIGTGTATLSLVVQSTGPLPVVTSAATASPTATLAFNYQIVATNSPSGYAASGLPSGLTINTSTGAITGTPTESGTFNVTLYATSPTLGTGTASLTLTVGNPSFSQWAAQHSTAASSPTATPKGDGVPNLLKYLYDIDPDTYMSAADRAKLPALGITMSGGSEYITLTYREYQFESGITMTLETSSDLKTWTPLTSGSSYYENMTPASDGSGDMIMEVGVKAAGSGKQFLQLNVTSP